MPSTHHPGPIPLRRARFATVGVAIVAALATTLSGCSLSSTGATGSTPTPSSSGAASGSQPSGIPTTAAAPRCGAVTEVLLVTHDSFAIPDDLVAELQKKLGDSVKLTDIARDAITLFNWAVNERAKGRLVLSSDEEGEKMIQLAMRSLDTVKRDKVA